jgi:hypothetical protein
MALASCKKGPPPAQVAPEIIEARDAGIPKAAVPKDPLFLPGTQPSENGIELAKVEQCKLCHAGTKNGEADPFFSWQAGMMSQAARDPVFRAALAVANQDVPGSGEYCIRCHAPRGWLEGRSKVTDGSALTPEDMHGVSCDVCHRLVDPLSEEAKKYAKAIPPGYGNGMLVADPRNVARGPYEDRGGAKPHIMVQTKYQGSSELCANCHNVSNPLQAKDVSTQPPHAYGHIERTYSEWSLSSFASGPGARTCQSCHYPAVQGGGQVSRFDEGTREHFVQHGAVGGSTWVQEAVAMLWPDSGLTKEHLEFAKSRARAFLKTAASLELRNVNNKAILRITNHTGHKLPTGYPEGRRLWVNVRYVNASGSVLAEIGRYGEKTATLGGASVKVPTLLDPEATRVYENLPGMSEAQAKRYKRKPGKSFHFVLNDVILKDNRIPPKGFNNAKFAEHQSQPVGAVYKDGQHWDDVPLAPPAGTKKILVRLYYQSVSWEYLKFLYEENKTDDWGKKLYDVWTKTGRCPPEVMAELEAPWSSQ